MISIIGAGIGGLTTALAFEKLGIEYQVFEQAPQLNPVGAGIWLAPNALQVMEWLGVLEDLKQQGNHIDRITLAQQNLKPLSDNPQDEIKAIFGFSTIAIHRAALQGLLFQKLPDDKIVLGKKFQKYEQSEAQIKVFFEDQHQILTDYLIAADGINSKVRKQLFPESQTRYSGQTCWRGVADFRMEEEFAHRGIEMWGKQVRFGISRIAADKVYWFAVASSEANQEDKEGEVKSKLLKMYADFYPLVTELIQHTSEDKILRNDINDLKPMPLWFQQNICLLGDAAHSTTPNMGQGGAQAIEDAYYLSNLIARENNPSQAFPQFQAKRFKKVNNIVKQSWQTGKMAHWKYGRVLRNFMLRSIPKSFLKKKMLEMYSLEKSFD